jgi:hypothetical protein
MFQRDDAFRGGSLQGHVRVSPAKLVEIFGQPDESDGYKVSGEFQFYNEETGEDFTLYDWKSTTLYDDYDGNPAPTPEAFWLSTAPYDFHIGGTGNCDLPAVIAAIESLETGSIEGRTFKLLE